jgi:hypothetical protein
MLVAFAEKRRSCMHWPRLPCEQVLSPRVQEVRQPIDKLRICTARVELAGLELVVAQGDLLSETRREAEPLHHPRHDLLPPHAAAHTQRDQRRLSVDPCLRERDPVLVRLGRVRPLEEATRQARELVPVVSCAVEVRAEVGKRMSSASTPVIVAPTRLRRRARPGPPPRARPG